MPSGSFNYSSIDSFDKNPATSSSLPSTSSFPSEHSSDQYRRNSSAKKRKVVRACDACRRRKTKCDGPKMADNICSKCAASRKPCTYLEASKPRGPPKAYIIALEDRLESLEGLLKRLRPDQDFDDELGPSIIRDSWKSDKERNNSGSSRALATPADPSKRIAPLALQTARNVHETHEPHEPHDYYSDSDYSSDSDGLVDKYTTGMERLTLRGPNSTAEEDENHTRFHGKSSSMNLIDATRKFKQLHIQETIENAAGANPSNGQASIPPHTFSSGFTRRPEYWRFPKWEFVWEGMHLQSPDDLSDVLPKFPPEELANDLFDLYFHHINILFPLLHRPTFERQWKERLHERDIWFACLAMSIFAVASRWSNDVRVLPESEQHKPPDKVDWALSGWKYFSVCISIHRMRRSLFFPASLFEIQTFNTLAFFLRGSSTQASAWLLIAMGMRKAQDAGAHRKTIYRRTPTVDDELWRRAFWILVGLDRMTSAVLGRPCSIDEANFDLDPPLDVDDEYWENDDPNLAFQQPKEKPSKITSFILWLSLTDTIALALRTIYAIRPSSVLTAELSPPPAEAMVKQLDTLLTKWIDKVPERLKWSKDLTDHIISNQATMLFITYHYTQILIHRPFIRPMRPAYLERNLEPSSDLALCCNAAQSCVRIIKRQLDIGYSSVIELINMAQVASAILIIEVWHLKTKERVHQVTGDEDSKPKYVQKVQALTDDVETLMKALEWAKTRYGHLSWRIDMIKDALPSPEDDEKALEIPLYTFNETVDSSHADVSSAEQIHAYEAQPVNHPPPTAVQSLWSSGVASTPVETAPFSISYSPPTAPPPLARAYPSVYHQSTVGDTNDNALTRHPASHPPTQYAVDPYWSPSDSGGYPVQPPVTQSYTQPRRQGYSVPPTTIPSDRYSGVEEYSIQPSTTHRGDMDLRSGYHNQSQLSPLEHPYSIKDPEYRPFLGGGDRWPDQGSDFSSPAYHNPHNPYAPQTSYAPPSQPGSRQDIHSLYPQRSDSSHTNGPYHGYSHNPQGP